ncbi:phosphodiester glycosidase family protein [Deinococcus sp. A31D244]|uniref:phosphodiester glycosidase family protein n=1 Tax=Deinococcus sp. A31D244 TaxID=3397675 RepID=UPI0039E09537
MRLLPTLLLTFSSLAGAASLSTTALTLGQPGLTEQRRTVILLPGVTLTSIERGQLAGNGVWTVNIAAVATQSEGEKKLADLKAAGFTGRLDSMQTQGTVKGDLGFMVRVGSFTARAEADSLLSTLKTRGLSGGVQFTGEDGGKVTGPWSIQVLSIEPGAQTRVRLALATDTLPGRETTSTLARRLGAVAAVNGGFFVINNDIGTEGDLAGISVVDGKLLSEAIDGRPAFLLSRKEPGGQLLQGVTSTLTLKVGETSRRATGINRKPGFIVNCGNFAATPTTRPAHDLTCQAKEELVAFTSAFGEQSDAGEGFEVAVGSDGNILSVQEKRGMTIPREGMTVQATGEAGAWLKNLAQAGVPVTLMTTLTESSGQVIPLNTGTDIVNGGPTLVKSGKALSDYAAEGWSPEGFTAEGAASAGSRLNFFNGWVLRRNPRTAIGTMSDGTLLLVTVDGRNPTHSVGASIPEMAQLMRDLGAVDAMNLDGGGSTATYANGMLQGIPSDTAGERPDGDAILIFPR